MKIFNKIFKLLSQRERKQALILMIMTIIMALLDLVGVASIMPFVAVLINPEIIETNDILMKLFNYLRIFGVTSTGNFLFSLGVIVFLLLVISLTFKALTNYFQIRFIQMRHYTISRKLVESYLRQPYSWFLNRNSADLGKSILSEVALIIENGLKPMIILISQTTIIISLTSLLIFTDPKLILSVSIILISLYGLVFITIRNFLNFIGEQRLNANQERFKSVSEAFGAIKEVKVGRLEQTYLDKFSIPALIFARHQASSQSISQLPRFFLEAIAFGGILLIILYLMKKSGTFTTALPIIALYIFCGYRLMPAVQQIYASITQLRYIAPAINSFYDELISLKSSDFSKSKNELSLTNSLKLKKIKYSYPSSSRTSLKNIDISISAKTKVGFVGSTGSGKTTIIDIIMGLLEANDGFVEVDGKRITKNNYRSWQGTIGYVPQQIYLSDDSIESNIAFGVESKNINQKQVEQVAKIANLHDFIVNELPNKYQTKVGERGVRLSGGQRQRIGIARALYHKPSLLILDEATSALDNLTEKNVMKEIDKISNNLTIILVAHRLNTVKECDKIFILEDGEIKNQGNFDTLIKTSKSFRYNVNNH